MKQDVNHHKMACPEKITSHYEELARAWVSDLLFNLRLEKEISFL